MQSLSFQMLKTQGSKAIPDDQVVYLIVNSKAKSVLVPPAEYESLVAAFEELQDLKAIEERKHEKTVPLKKAFMS